MARGCKAFCRKHNNLGNAVRIDCTDAFQTNLHNFFELVRALGYAVYILVIIDLLDNALIVAAVLDNGQRNVGLESHKLAVKVGKGYDSVAHKEILILCVEVIGFKLAHSELFEASVLIKLTQSENSELIIV